MSTAKKATSEASAPAEGKAGKSSGKKILVFLLLGLLVLSAGGGAAWFFLAKKNHVGNNKQSAEEKASHDDEHAKKLPPAFYTMERLTVNLQRSPSGEGNYLQTVIDLRLVDAKFGDQIKQHAPIINHEVVLLLSSKNSAWLEITENKVKLAGEIRDKVNSILKITDPKQGVQAAYFSVFIIQ